MAKKVFLLTLQTFSATGGIQKMARTLAHALQHICTQKNWQFRLLSLYDANEDLQTRYLPAYSFKGFRKNRTAFVMRTMMEINNADTIILSHINFAIIGVLIKLFKPDSQVWLIAHGIEVWRPLSLSKKLLLRHCDKVVCVSAFTREQMLLRHGANPEKCVILNNAIDPFIALPRHFDKPEGLLKRYSLAPDTPIIFTLTRLASTEKYKGYDNVIIAIKSLKVTFPRIRYILAGKYDQKEEYRVKELIRECDVADHVIMTGFVAESELAEHFLMADLFVLPSKKEGFGIVFIEALSCGLPVICGNADGSIDAIKGGELGTAINPDDQDQLEEAIARHLSKPPALEKRQELQRKCIAYFREEKYIEDLGRLLITPNTRPS